MKQIVITVLCLTAFLVRVTAQQNLNENRVGLDDRAVALDANNAPALEATLLTRSLSGAADTPVTNIRMIVKNVGNVPLSFVSGLVTFYDGAGVRCGEGVFKADAVAVNESFETDTPGIRIRCAATNWRIVVTNLLPRIVPTAIAPQAATVPAKLVISVDGESHPIQVDRPMTLILGERQRTIVLRRAP